MKDDTERILRPDEMARHWFLLIEFGAISDFGEFPEGLLALHLRDESGESPIFGSVEENLQISLGARNAYAWFDDLIDGAITSMSEFLTAR